MRFQLQLSRQINHLIPDLSCLDQALPATPQQPAAPAPPLETPPPGCPNPRTPGHLALPGSAPGHPGPLKRPKTGRLNVNAKSDLFQTFSGPFSPFNVGTPFIYRPLLQVASKKVQFV